MKKPVPVGFSGKGRPTCDVGQHVWKASVLFSNAEAGRQVQCADCGMHALDDGTGKGVE